MRRFLLATTCLASLTVAAGAETTISTKLTQPVRSSTVKAGMPDDVTIAAAGSVVVAGTNAVLLDSNNKLINAGTIQITNVDHAVGVDVLAGTTGSIVNSGKIIIDESYAPTDADKDGDLDGPFAVGLNRVGLRTQGAFTGNITNSGSIEVEGNNSFGIRLGGPLTGNFVNDGAVKVLGDHAVGVALGRVDGNVRLAGDISAQGLGAVGARVDGPVNGALVVQGHIVATGYRYTTAPADPSKLDADDLLQGGSALVIADSVSKGIILAVPPKDLSPTDNDEDKDGIDDSKEGAASVIAYGAAPAMLIGASGKNIAIGAVPATGTGFGLIVDGSILGDGVYAGVDGNALLIGGQGGTVTIAGGIGITGSIRANSSDRAATAVHLAAGAATPELRNAGTIEAIGGKTATAVASAVVIDAGASLTTLRNSGTIKASVSSSDGTASAIVDKSGTLSLIENSGAITATGASATSNRNIAIDLSANTSGAIIRQTIVASPNAAPSITGDVRLGSGNDLVDIADGTLAGTVSFGSGDNRFTLSGDAAGSGKLQFGGGADTVLLSGTSTYNGLADFGGGNDILRIGGTATFSAQLANAGGLAITVDGGTMGIVKSGSIQSLGVTNGGTLAVLLDKTPGSSSHLDVAGAATFGDGTKLKLSVANVAQAEGHYVVIDAGSLVGADKITASGDILPFLYNGKITTTGNQLGVDILRKTNAQLGLNRSESAAFSAIYTAIGKDNAVGGAFLNIRDQQHFVGTVRQMLPDHAGGTFEAVTMGDRSIARQVSDPAAPFNDEGGISYWANQLAWGSTKSVGDSAGYKIGGWGVGGGADVRTKIGRFGASLAYLWGTDDDQATANTVAANQYALAAYWRLSSGNFRAMARASVGRVAFKGTRLFSGDNNGQAVSKTIESKWKGTVMSATAGVGHETYAGKLFVRPSANIEYYRLAEGAHQDSGGGAALDLFVEKRKSDELAVNGLVTAGFDLGAEQPDDGYFRLELEGGRRQLIGGSLGDTRAHFASGQTFTLVPEVRRSGWLARVRAIGGNAGFRISGELGAEQREDKLGVSARAGLVLGI